MPQTLNLITLNADLPVPTVLSHHATYGSIFHSLLLRASYTLPTSSTTPPTITHTDYSIRTLSYPPAPLLATTHAILISGSAASAYDDEHWIHVLHTWIRDVFQTHPHVKWFGSCFGHQVLCRALLDWPRGAVVVERDPKGWELGVQRIRLNKEFRRVFGGGQGVDEMAPESVRLQFIHADHVRIHSPAAIPPGWMTVGSTSHCAVQGMYLPGRVFTLQGHFEFDRFVNAEIMKVFFREWDEEVLRKVLESVERDDDAEVVAGMVLRFFVEGWDEDTVRNGAVDEVTEQVHPSVLQHPTILRCAEEEGAVRAGRSELVEKPVCA